MTTSSYISFSQETGLGFSSYDGEEEVFEAIKQAMLAGSEFSIVQQMSLISFELTNPFGNPLCVDGSGSSYCEENEGLKILAQENLSFTGKARVTAVDYANVSEPSTNLLLAMGIIGLMSLRRRF